VDEKRITWVTFLVGSVAVPAALAALIIYREDQALTLPVLFLVAVGVAFLAVALWISGIPRKSLYWATRKWKDWRLKFRVGKDPLLVMHKLQSLSENILLDDLARRFNFDNETLDRAVKKLEKHGLVKTVKTASGVLIRLTQSGGSLHLSFSQKTRKRVMPIKETREVEIKTSEGQPTTQVHNHKPADVYSAISDKDMVEKQLQEQWSVAPLRRLLGEGERLQLSYKNMTADTWWKTSDRFITPAVWINDVKEALPTEQLQDEWECIKWMHDQDAPKIFNRAQASNTHGLGFDLTPNLADCIQFLRFVIEDIETGHGLGVE